MPSAHFALGTWPMLAMSRDVSPIFGRRVACKNRKEKKLVFGAPHPRATHFHVMKETRFKALAAQRGEHRRTKHRTKCRPLPFEHARKKKKKRFATFLSSHSYTSVGHGVDALSEESKKTPFLSMARPRSFSLSVKVEGTHSCSTAFGIELFFFCFAVL